MNFAPAIKVSFEQLINVLTQLRPEEYTRSSQYLSGATIGRHTRHIVELFQCLLAGLEGGIIDYDGRKRNPVIESDPEAAADALQTVLKSIQHPNKELQLVANFGYSDQETEYTPTNYYRELIYNLEHTIHHMALIKVGLNEIGFQNLPAEFGVASSTIRYRNECAQ